MAMHHVPNAGRVLRMASCMAPNADEMCRGLADYVSRKLRLSVVIHEDVDWTERTRLLDAGEVDLCWICGLYYIERAVRGQGIELCVAPVMSAPRYDGRPVYFSDIVVRSYSRFSRFADLRGETMAYNEPNSHSGYGVLGYHLAAHGESFDYFASMVEAGSHQASLQTVLSGKAAGAAIDSTVLEAEMRRDPALRRALRVIEILGPSPAPPWILSRSVPEPLRREIMHCLMGMERDPAGARVLESWGIAGLRRVTDGHYDPIRDMARVAASVMPSRRAREPGAARARE